MPNPYAAKRRTSIAATLEPDRAHLFRRLRALGATPDELAALADGWDLLDDTWTAADRAALLRANDTELLRKLAEVRDEYHVGTTDEATDQAVIDRQRAQVALDEARARIGSTINALAAWVADDPVRALAVVTAEQETTNPRPRLLARLDEVLA